jgi:hypothetical protein
MKFYLRRAIFSVITLPIVFVAYGVLYFGIGIMADSNIASVGAYLTNLPVIGIGYTLAIMFLPQLLRLVDKVVG